MVRFGRLKRAKEFLSAGLRVSEEHRLNVWYFKFESELKALEAKEAAIGTPAPELELTPPTSTWSPAVEEVAVGLREYALSAS
jgi:hypothetical protein